MLRPAISKDGNMDRWVDEKDDLRIDYSNQKMINGQSSVSVSKGKAFEINLSQHFE